MCVGARRMPTRYQTDFLERRLATRVFAINIEGRSVGVSIVPTLPALVFEGLPVIVWNPRLMLPFGYGGVIGVALACRAMAMVNRSLPAVLI